MSALSGHSGEPSAFPSLSERDALPAGGKILSAVFAIVFAWVLLQALASTWSFGAFKFALVVCAAAAGIAVFARAGKDVVAKVLGRLQSPKALVPICLAASVALLVVAQFLSTSIVDGTWDFPFLGRDAYAIASTGTLPDGRDAYYARYANNQTLLLLASGLFGLVLFLCPQADLLACHHVAIAANTLCIIAMVCLVALALKREYGAKAGTAFTLLAILFEPFWTYTAIYYSDMIPTVLVGAELLLFVEARNTDGKARFAFLLGLSITAGVAFQLKATTAFVFAGFVFVEAVDLARRRCPRKLRKAACEATCLLAFCLVVAQVGAAAQNALGISDEDYDTYKFPYTHWVMMSLNTTGGYNQDDVNLTREAGDKADKEAANIKVIKKRVKERGVGGTLAHLLVTKVQRTWGDGRLAGADYANRCPDHPESLAFSLFSEGGGRHGPVKCYAQAFWLFLLSLLVFASVKSRRTPPDPLAFVAMFALVMFFLFELVWECNARYVVHMAPLMLLLASIALAKAGEGQNARAEARAPRPCAGAARRAGTGSRT